MRIVTACDEDCLDELLVFLRSARRLAGLDLSEISVCYIARGNDAHVPERIRSQFPAIDLSRMRYDDRVLDPVRPHYEAGRRALFFDYVRAFLSERQAPMLWLDSDIILQEGFPAFSGMIGHQDPPIAMAPDFRAVEHSAGDFHYRMLGYYRYMYQKAYGSGPPEGYGHRKLNCGVLYVARPYFREWRQHFQELSPLVPDYLRAISPPEPFARGKGSSFGQGIWNLLFWRHAGLELGDEWNTLKFQDPDKTGFVHHYAMHKDAFRREARNLDPDRAGADCPEIASVTEP